VVISWNYEGTINMLDYIFGIGGFVTRYTGQMSSREWIYVAIGAAVVGFFLTRGFADKGRI
jgi:hypothetical protein